MNLAIFKVTAAAGDYLPDWLPVARDKDLGNRLEWSGLAVFLSPAEWGSLKRAAGALAAAFAFIYAPGWMGLAAAAPAYYAGTYIPSVLLDSACDKARAAIDRELAGFAENLAILTGAGLSLSLALPEAAAETAGPLGRYLAKAVNEINLGTPRRAAITAAAERTPSGDFKRLAGLIADAERFGTPVAAELSRMAADLRDKRMAALREEAQRLPVKMLFPLVFMILPSFILLTAGPLFLSMT